MYNHYGYQPMMGYNGFDSALSYIFWIILITFLIIAVLRYAFGRPFGMRGRMMRRHMMMHGMDGFGENSALKILQERFAKGEISKEEFEERKQVLMQ